MQQISQAEFDALDSHRKHEIVQEIHRTVLAETKEKVTQFMTLLMNGEMTDPETGQIVTDGIEDFVALSISVHESIVPEPIREQIIASGEDVCVSVTRRKQFAESILGGDGSYGRAAKVLFKHPGKGQFYSAVLTHGSCSIVKQTLSPKGGP
jgi:hypothetical protein